uniref:Uncharacterized protein LOC114329531 isoform X2 n=1 Tax=Diabrotica virgifera virgifera TaxID=50390 RepID=A0A6P7FEM3_DIAVI
MLLQELTIKQLREQLEEYELDSSGCKIVLQARLKEVLTKNGDDPETFHFQSAEQAILSKLKTVSETIDDTSKISNEKFESVSQKIDETSRKSDEKFENVAKRFNETSQIIKEVCRQNNEKLEEVCKQNNEKFEEVSRTFDKMQKSVDDNKEMLEEKIKQLESMITDTKVQPSVNAATLDPLVKDELPRDETSHNMRFKLPPFDGKSSWSIYLRQFEAIATDNHWTEQEKAVSLTAALRGDAADILRSIPKGQEKCYQTLFTRLEKSYGDAHLQQVYKAQRRSRSQRASENLQELEADVARVVRLAYPEVPDSVLEEMAVDTFVIGLKDNELQKALRLARPKVLDEALAIALEHETASQTSRSHRVRTIEESDEHNDERLEEMIRRVLSNQMPKRREPRCWNCGDVGHIRRNCKKIVQPSEN